MQPIFLIGYMGSGKTTLGRVISRTMKLEFIDLDIYIEARYHHTIKELFAIHGEDGFRKIEKNVLHEVADFENVIVACGGGTPCHFDNMEYMNAHGLTIFLDASIPSLMGRLTIPSAKSKRPLIANKTDEELEQFITDALQSRMQYYDKAKVRFNASNLETFEQIAHSAQSLQDTIAKNI